MDLKAKFTEDMKAAMKAGESTKLGVLRMLISEVKKREIDKREALSETEVQKTISTLIKQREDSVEAFTKGNRPDLADKEKAEAEVLRAYLPAQMSREEVEAIVVAAIQETGAKAVADIGKVMKAVLPKVAGKADGKIINEIAKSKLS